MNLNFLNQRPFLRRIARYLGLLPLEYTPKNGPVTVTGEVSRVSKDIVVALGMALIVIQFVIQAFKIPSGSMENSLLIGDFLLGLKYVYGSPVPFSYAKLPGLREPKKNDVVIFKFPGDPNYPYNDETRSIKLLNTFIFGILFWDKVEKKIILHAPKDFIKRCVAGPGDTLLVRDKQLLINGQAVALAPRGQFSDPRTLPPEADPRDNFGPYVVPRKGQRFILDSLSMREFYWVRSLIYQENPKALIKTAVRIYVDDTVYTVLSQKGALYVKYTDWDWHALQQQLSHFQLTVGSGNVKVRWEMTLDGRPMTEYTLGQNAFFMMGDNRDNSLDSRYWGYVSKKFVKAEAFIIYFSWDGLEPAWNAIRFSRIGKLIL
ncbi:MAG: signal peptidase I [Fibrobacterota bacterium]